MNSNWLKKLNERTPDSIKMIFGNISGLRNIIKGNIFAEIFIYKSNCFLQIMNVCVTGWGIGSEICIIIVSKYINQNGNNAVSHFGLVTGFLLFAFLLYVIKHLFSFGIKTPYKPNQN